MHSPAKNGEVISIVWARHIVMKCEVERLLKFGCGITLCMAIF